MLKSFRHIYDFKVIAALVAITLNSCQESMTGGVCDTVTLTVVSDMPLRPNGDGVDTKTMWDGKTILWTSGDKISIGIKSDQVWEQQLFESKPLEEDMKLAVFATEVPSALKGSLQFYSVYPSSTVSGDLSQAPYLDVVIPPVQTPLAESFDPSSDLMVGKTNTTYTDIPKDNIPLYWTRLVAHADITLTSLNLAAGEVVESVSFAAQDGLALTGDYLLDVETQGLTASGENQYSHVVLNGDNLELKADKSLRVWASFAPCKITELTVSVKTDKATYTRKLTSCLLEFRKNTRNILSVDMSAAMMENDPSDNEALNALINPRLSSVLNLDSPGLETVKSLFARGESYLAAKALKEYWKTGRTIVNPDVNLNSTSYSQVEKNRAEQALKENGFRFYVKNYAEVGNDSDADAKYYSFDDGKGGINWNFTLSGETQFNIQKHRHQWVLPQAKVYWGTKDEKYVKSYIEVYSSWLAAHPCPGNPSDGYGIASKNPLRDMWTDLQATSRIMDQISVLDYYINSESFTPEFFSHFLVAFADAVECIRANPYYEQLSNHRLYEIQAVFAAAIMMPEFKAASEWLSEASDDIRNQLQIQFADDGVLVEMDPGYHIPMVAIFYDSHKIAAANNKTSAFPDNYTASLEKAVKFVRDLAYPDYSIDNFNDVRSSSWNKSTLTKNFVKYAEMFPDDATLEYWASGFSSGSAPEELLSKYTATGWYMLRNAWHRNSTMLVLKNNYNVRENGGVWWHCQPDNGTVSLYHKGRHFLPDAGAYTYTNGSDRDAFRATAMHNTLTRNLETIADNRMLGEFVNSSVSDDVLMVHVKNQSYGNLRHERVVFMVEGKYYVIVDSALGSATNTSVELSWHLCPGSIAFDSYSGEKNAYGCHTEFVDGNNMIFKTYCFSGNKGLIPDETFLSTNGTSYTSSEINEKTERKFYRTSVSIEASNTPVRFITVIYPVIDFSSAPEVSAGFGTSASKVEVLIDGKSRTLTY